MLACREEARSRGARLALPGEAHRPDDALDRPVLVRVREHDRGALAAELQRDRHDTPGRLLHDELPDLGGAGERELAHAGMGAKRGAAVVAVAGEDVEHRGRQMLLADPGEHENAERGVLGRLQHHGVAGAKGRGDLERGEQHRRVPRDDRAHHPDRLAPRIAQQVLPERQGLALELAREATEVPEDIRGQRRLGPRLGAERIAGLGGDDARKLLDPRLDRVGDPEQPPPALARGHVPPACERLGRGLYRPIDVLGAGAGHVGEDAPVRRVLDGNSLAGGAVDAFAVEQHSMGVGDGVFLHECGTPDVGDGVNVYRRQCRYPPDTAPLAFGHGAISAIRGAGSGTGACGDVTVTRSGSANVAAPQGLRISRFGADASANAGCAGCACRVLGALPIADAGSSSA